MTDQNLADKMRPILDEWERIKEHAEWMDMDNLVQNLRALLPTPPRPTLADMTAEERSASRRMQCDYKGITRNTTSRGVIGYFDHEERKAVILTDTNGIVRRDYDRVTPRPDLPRMEWPGDTPAPALPEGWRLADHQKRGRVIVTTTPDPNGRVYFALPADRDRTGFGWNFCDHSELTYLDGPGTPPSADPSPEVHPGVTVGEPVTDPQVMLGISIDAPDGTVVVGHTADYHPTATVKSGSTWQSTAGMRAHLYHALGAPDYSELESVTVVRWGKETDQ